LQEATPSPHERSTLEIDLAMTPSPVKEKKVKAIDKRISAIQVLFYF
jgi:hypothetical protein